MKQALKFSARMLVMALLMGAPLLVAAQGGFDDDVQDNPVPFDGGVSLLVAAGVGYGLKKARDYRKAQKEQENL